MHGSYIPLGIHALVKSWFTSSILVSYPENMDDDDNYDDGVLGNCELLHYLQSLKGNQFLN